MTLNKSSYECYSKDNIKDIINKKYKPPKKKNSQISLDEWSGQFSLDEWSGQFSLDEWSEEHPTMFSVILIIVVLIVAVAIFIPLGMASWEEGKKSAYPQASQETRVLSAEEIVKEYAPNEYKKWQRQQNGKTIIIITPPSN